MTLFVRLAAIITGILILPIALIRAQPYTNPALHDLLASASNCATPCLIGLQPGITSETEAIAHFNQTENINYTIVQKDGDVAVLHWRDTSSPFSGQIYLTEGHVTEVTIQGARLYDVWFALGEPDGGTMMANEMINVGQNIAFNLPYAHIEYYASHDLRVETAANCPRFWQQLVFITLTAEPISETGYPNPLGNRRREICESQRVYQRLGNR